MHTLICFVCSSCLGLVVPLLGFLTAFIAIASTPTDSRRRQAGVTGLCTGLTCIFITFAVLWFLKIKYVN